MSLWAQLQLMGQSQTDGGSLSGELADPERGEKLQLTSRSLAGQREVSSFERTSCVETTGQKLIRERNVVAPQALC